MAIQTIWQTNNGDMSDAASWTQGVPGDTDIGLMDGSLSQKSAISGLTFSTRPTIITTPEFLGDIGQPGNLLGLGSGALVQHIFRGLGTVHWGGSGSVVNLVVDSLNLRNAVDVQSDVGSVWVKSGRVNLESPLKFTAATSWLVLNGELAHVVMDQTTNSNRVPDTVRVLQGFLENKRDFEFATDRMLVAGGNVIQTGLFKSTMTVYVTGGLLRYEPASDPVSEAPFFLIDGGVLDLRGSQFDIPTTDVQVSRGGKILGGSINKTASFTTIDLREDYP